MFVKHIALVSIAGSLLVGCVQIIESPRRSSDAASVFERTSPSVVIVLRDFVGDKYSDQGSGVVIAPAQVVTNCHVVKGHKTVHVAYLNKVYPAQLKFSDTVHDLCILDVANLSAPSTTLRSSRSLRVGESVYAVSAPRSLQNVRILKNTYERFSDSAVALSQFQLSVSEGLISALHPIDGQLNHIQTTAAFAGGSSGGGLFDQQGRLVGITTFYNVDWKGKIQDTQLYFALPSDWIAHVPERAAQIAKAGGQEDYVEWLQRASTLKQNKDWPALVAHCQKEIAINRRIIDPYLYLGVGLTKLKQYEKAVQALKTATEIDQNSSAAWNNLGQVYNDLKQYDKAIEYYEKAIRLDPQNAIAWSNLGSVYDDLKQYDKAIEYYEKAIRLDPQNAITWSNLGQAYDHLKQYDKAIEYYEKAIRLDPQNAITWSNLGQAYDHLKQYDKAIEYFEKAIRLDPQYAVFWNNLGSVYDALKQYDKAIEYYEKAIRLDPQYAVFWNNLGSVYDALKQYDKAIEYYEKAIRLDPQNAVFWNNLGVTYNTLGNKQEVAKVHQTLLKLDRAVAEEFSKQYLSGEPIQQ